MINKGIVVTTWDYLNYVLLNGQFFDAIIDDKLYEVDGIVTINKDSNIAVIKLKDNSIYGVKLSNNINLVKWIKIFNIL